MEKIKSKIIRAYRTVRLWCALKFKTQAFFKGRRESCSRCGWSGNFRLETRFGTHLCPYCRSGILFANRIDRQILPGAWSSDVNSDCYVRPDKDHQNEAGRQLEWTYNRIWKMESTGQIPKYGDRKVFEHRRKVYRDWFGPID